MSRKTILEYVSKRIVLYSGLAILALILTISLVAIIPYYSELKFNVEHQFKHELEAREILVNSYITRVRDVAMQITSRTRIRDQLELYNYNELSLEKLESVLTPTLNDAMEMAEDVVGITRLDQNNQQVAQCGLSVSQEYWPVPDEQSHDILIRGPVALEKGSVFVVGAPVFNRQSVRLGTDIIVFEFSALLDVVAFQYGDEKSVESILGVRDENSITLFAPQPEGRHAVTSAPFNSPLGSVMSTAFQDEEGWMVTDQFVIASAPVKNTDWALAVKIEKAVLYAPAYRHLLRLLLVIGGLLVCGIGGVIFSIRPLTRALQEERAKRKQAEESVLRFGRILDSSHNEIFTFAADSLRFSLVSLGARRNLGYSLAELKEMTPLDFKPEITSERFDELLRPLRTGEQQQVVFETIHQRKDGSLYPVEIRLQLSSAETPPVFVAIVLDITRRKQIEENLRNTHDELIERAEQLELAKSLAEEANRAKSEFLANMSHELKTPLNAIIGFSEIMVGGMAGELAQDQKEYLQEILNSGRDLLSMIKDILELAQLDNSGRVELVRSSVDVRALIENSLDQQRTKETTHDLRIASEIAEDVTMINADAGKLQLVLTSLLDNAIKFTPDGGVITVKARRVAADTLEVSVNDTGIGINSGDFSRLFKPFRQIESYLNKQYAGVGIGLALCKRIVEMHGGRIWVESEEGRGSTFLFEIPITHSAGENV